MSAVSPALRAAVVGAAGALACAALAAVAFTPPAAAATGWHASLEKGVDAAKRSGRPLLVVTAWPTGICGSCDTWRDRVQKNDRVLAAAARYECVEWLYDGLGGKVIAWTKEHGNRNDDPSVLAWVADASGAVIAQAGEAYAPDAFAKWLDEQADAYERTHPQTRVPFAPAELVGEGEGAERSVRCPAVDAAREEGRLVLVYLGRSERAGDDKAAKAEAAAARKLEKGLLASQSAADSVAGALLVRLDAGDADALRYARALGARSVPALLVIAPGAESAEDLGVKLSAQSFAYRMKKLAKATREREGDEDPESGDDDDAGGEDR